MFIEYYQIAMVFFSLIVLYVVTVYRACFKCYERAYFLGIKYGSLFSSSYLVLELDKMKIASLTKEGIIIPFREELKLTEQEIINLQNVLK